MLSRPHRELGLYLLFCTSFPTRPPDRIGLDRTLYLSPHLCKELLHSVIWLNSILPVDTLSYMAGIIVAL